MADNKMTFTALNRFGFGPKFGEARQVSKDPQAWLRSKIKPQKTLPVRLQKYDSYAVSMSKIYHSVVSENPEDKRLTRRKLHQIFHEETADRTRVMIETDNAFYERLVTFWANHFTVSRSRPWIAPGLAAYEREAIRPHVFGKFEDMLLAAIGHPSMLFYLDNIKSIGPNSALGLRGRRSYNENLAREILELHTLGVNGGYGLEDVKELALGLTGWADGAFMFRQQDYTDDIMPVFKFIPRIHEPGTRTVMGETFPQNGVEQGRAILRHLAHHPATSEFIAQKLVRHFVADDPPAAAVKTIAKAFRDTKGDLAKISAALIDLKAAWAQPLSKVKTPHELVVSLYRVAGWKNIPQRHILEPLKLLEQEPFFAPSPAGWGDEAGDWLTSGALIRRLEWIRAICARIPLTRSPRDILAQAGLAQFNPALSRKVENAPSADYALALIFCSAEFQRR